MPTFEFRNASSWKHLIRGKDSASRDYCLFFSRGTFAIPAGLLPLLWATWQRKPGEKPIFFLLRAYELSGQLNKQAPLQNFRLTSCNLVTPDDGRRVP